MNKAEIKMLLGAAATIDPTVPTADGQVLSVWSRMLHEVPPDAGFRALEGYYKSAAYRATKRTVTPGDIYGAWREERADLHERQIQHELREQRQTIKGARSIPSIHALFAAERAEARGEDPQAAAAVAGDRSRWLGVPCPYCGARERQGCVARGTQRGLRRVHPARIEAADAAQGGVSS